MATGDDNLYRLLRNVHILGFFSRSVLEEKYLLEAVGEGITFTHLNVLKMVALSGHHYLGDVAHFMDVSYAAASKLIDRMEARKLLKRVRFAGDRRAELLKLTPLGRSVIRRYDRHKLARLRAQFRDIGDQDARGLAESLERLLDIFLKGRELNPEACLRCGAYASGSCLLLKAGAECPYREQRISKRISKRMMTV